MKTTHISYLLAEHSRGFLLGLSLVAVVATPMPSEGEVLTTSPEFEDVADTLAAAADGDTVEIRAGSATWSDVLTIDKAVTLKGAGVGETVITVNVSSDSDVGNVNSDSVIKLTCKEDGLTRITGIEFDGNQVGGGIAVSGPKWGRYRIDHCKFTEMASRAVRNDALLSGLIDNCTFLDCNKTVDIYASNHMNESWAEELTLGTTRTTVVEDCEFLYESWYPRSAAATSSHGLGGRGTWRHNTWKNRNPDLSFYPILDAHGNQEPVSDNVGDHRGTRQFEIYQNTFHSDVGVNARLTDIRGGTGVLFSNSYSGDDFQTSFYMREEDAPYKNDYKDSYPGYDQHWVHLWDNEVNGSPVDTIYTAHSDDYDFIIEGTNLFWEPRPDYTPLAYPHPFREESSSAPAAPSNLEIADQEITDE